LKHKVLNYLNYYKLFLYKLHVHGHITGHTNGTAYVSIIMSTMVEKSVKL